MKSYRKHRKKMKIRKASSNIFDSSKDLLNNTKNYKEIYINESLYNFNKNSKNELLNELINNLIEFRKLYFDIETNNKSLTLSYILSNYLFYHNLEKNLIEITYLPENTRNEKILSLYKWYKNTLNKNNCLKNINLKLQKEPNIISCNKFDNESHDNNIITEKNNKVDNINNKSENNKQKEKLKKSIKKIRILSTKSKKRETEMNRNKKVGWDFMTHLYTKINCSNSATIPKSDNSYMTDNIQKEEKEVFLPKVGSSSKFSYSYNKPCLSCKNIEFENKIIKNKYQLLAEKRSLESIDNAINEFGINRAKLKENINNKQEIKKLIKMYVNNESGQHLNLNITSPLLKKYKKILIKPILKEKEKLFKNNSMINIFEKEKRNNINNKNILKLPFKEKKLIDKNIYKEGKKIINSYFNKKNNEINNILNEKINKSNKKNRSMRLFYGINHIKIYMDKIKNIDKKTNLIKENENIQKIDIKFKISEKSNKNILKNNNLNNSSMDIHSQIFSSEALIEQKLNYLNYINHLGNKENEDETETLKNDEIKEEELNKKDNDNDKENKDETETESYYNPFYYNLSAFHINNLELFNKKSRNENNNNKNTSKTFDLNIKKKIEMKENYEKNKNNFLLMRKNMVYFKKRELEQLKNRIRNIKFNHSNRYDNIDEDKEEFELEDKKEGNYNSTIKKNEILFKERIPNNIIENKYERRKKEYSLENALINPNDNSGYLLYYYPRPGSSLLMKK